MIKNQILDNYTLWTPSLKMVFEQLEISLHQRIVNEGPKIHSFSGRLKTLAGLKQKISRPDRNYTDLWELTDLLAFRVITYSEDMIEPVAHLIEQFFDVDYLNSTNKLRHLDDQKFGYRSLHYVCSLSKEIRALHPELPDSLRFEIQIRTILQHTWAEIEHDIGYKASTDLPGAFRRRFSQVANILEMADREFAAIRNDIKTYEESLKRTDFDGPELVGLDDISLKSILEREEIRKLDKIISRHLDRPLAEEQFYPDYLIRALLAAGLKSVRSVLEEARLSGPIFETFVDNYFSFSKQQWNFGKQSIDVVLKGYGLLFVAHLAVIRKEKLLLDKHNLLTQFYKEIDFPDDLEKAQHVSRELLASLKLQL